jgi:glycine cleavage system H protein
VAVGVDDLRQKVFGPVDEVVLPAVGTQVRAFEPLLTLRRGDRTLVVRAPVDGTVQAVNETLKLDPELVNRAPYGDGWTVALEAPKRALANLRVGQAAAAWLRGELDRLVAAVAEPATVRTLQDGGPISPAFFHGLDEAAFRRLADEFFGGR